VAKGPPEAIALAVPLGKAVDGAHAHDADAADGTDVGAAADVGRAVGDHDGGMVGGDKAGEAKLDGHAENGAAGRVDSDGAVVGQQRAEGDAPVAIGKAATAGSPARVGEGDGKAENGEATTVLSHLPSAPDDAAVERAEDDAECGAEGPIRREVANLTFLRKNLCVDDFPAVAEEHAGAEGIDEVEGLGLREVAIAFVEGGGFQVVELGAAREEVGEVWNGLFNVVDGALDDLALGIEIRGRISGDGREVGEREESCA
jgi:hypothetical protein